MRLRETTGWKRLALALGVGTLALAVVVVSPGTASATGIDPAIIAGEVTAAPITELATTECALTAAETLGVGCGIAALAIGLYATRDLWLPFATGAWNHVMNFLGSPGATTTCTTAVSLAQANGSGGATVTWSHSGCAITDITVYFKVRDLYCSYSGGTVTGPTPAGHAFMIVGSTGYSESAGQHNFNYQPCGAGGTIAAMDFMVQQDQAGYSAFSRIFTYIDNSLGPTTTTTTHCKSYDGTTYDVTATVTGGDKVPFASCEQGRAGTGGLPTGATIKTGPAGTPGQTVETITVPDMAPSYPDCFGPSGLLCSIRVFVHGNPCYYGAPDCYDWYHYADGNPSQVKCKFGAYVVAMRNCDPLKKSYQTNGSRTVTTDPDSVTGVGTGTAPSTGLPEWVDGCMTTDCDPAPACDDAPTASAADACTPEAPPEKASCIHSALSWNPLKVIYVGVKCALIWAFVPDDAPSFTDIANPIPAGWVPSFPGLSDGSCGPVTLPAVDFGNLLGTIGPTTMLNTCSAPWPAARNVTYYGLLAALLVGLGNRAYGALTRSAGMNVEGSDDG